MDDFIWSDPPSRWAFPMATAGYPLLFGAGFVTLVLAQLGLTALTLAALVATFCIAGFFRDPDRVIPNRPGIVVSPADGRVISVERLGKTPFFDGSCYKICIFMSVFNVHVNRIPAEGRVYRISYRPGQFVAADRTEASLRNEHNAVFLETSYGRRLCVVQVAALRYDMYRIAAGCLPASGPHLDDVGGGQGQGRGLGSGQFFGTCQQRLGPRGPRAANSGDPPSSAARLK